MILLMRTDSPSVYVGVWDGDTELAQHTWEAGRGLSQNILSVIETVCVQAGIVQENLSGIGIYEGPGSYTGLRIGFSVVNSLGYSYQIPVAAAASEQWQQNAIVKLNSVNYFIPVQPVYGGQVYTTKPKK